MLQARTGGASLVRTVRLLDEYTVPAHLLTDTQVCCHGSRLQQFLLDAGYLALSSSTTYIPFI